VASTETFVLIFRTGDEVMENLSPWVGDQDVTAANLTAIRSVQRRRAGLRRLKSKDYRESPILRWAAKERVPLTEGEPERSFESLRAPTVSGARSQGDAGRVGQERRDLAADAIAGAAGGLAGGAVMTVAMSGGRKAGILQAPLPLKVERWGRRRLAVSAPSPEHEHLLAQTIHLSYSLFLGVGYGLVQHARALPALPSGPLYGLLVYAANIAGALPALGVISPPADMARTKVARQVMMHVVFGSATALVFERVREKLADA
jgi:hypothetical protein